MKIKGEVLECKSGVGKKSGKPFHIALVRINGTVGKIFSDVALVPGAPEDLEVEISSNQEMFLGLRIKSAPVIEQE